MTTSSISSRIVRYGELRPCKTAFIDAHTPGSDQKENFTIIGGGVSESPDQHVHLTDKIGFNIGAAGQPPKCRNSLHSHTTAEVFFVLKGRWRFFWGRYGDAGEFVAEEGDIFNIPTGIFRGFENIGTDYGMIMAILGGDDAGGGVTWAPQVIEEAQSHGLMLGENGVLYDSKKGQKLPHNVGPMPLLSEEQLKAFPETPVEDVVPYYVARYWDMMAMAGKKPAKVIGADAMLRDKPGFEVDFLTRGSLGAEMITAIQPTVLMPMRGHWHLRWDGGSEILNPGDTSLIHAAEAYSLEPAMTGECSLYRVTATDDVPGMTWTGN
ncbi:Mannose-6-phosphate isomerase, cupin superfamily [Epibacterium ulvae]|uniref:Mannose-6-phosphate isomerase, cupin superfamily n=1 Tax=Epibacterium ulvae TaxID=1156985 RepID=A0A1G5QJI6_9RHOB|nr:cupin domain-containing protein [Epibacterium ulvae]SCZ61917.1 Mannose-6-phosphate isomerase, cupin superfamily [Epibacterium ulvae]